MTARSKHYYDRDRNRGGEPPDPDIADQIADQLKRIYMDLLPDAPVKDGRCRYGIDSECKCKRCP